MADELLSLLTVTKYLNRRRFLALTGLGTAASATWVSTSQSWTPRFIRDRFAEIGKPILKPNHKPVPSDWSDTKITASWLGHATVLVNFYGLNILTDPVLFSRVGADLGVGTLGPKRRIAPALRPRELPHIDLVLLSHAHLDHFDTRSLETLPKTTKAVSARNTADLFGGLKLSAPTELKWGEKTLVHTAAGEIEVEAFEVRHWGARWRHDTQRGYNGYILRRGGKSIIFGGDTAFTRAFGEIHGKGPYEMAIMPIGAYNPWYWSHCNPEEALKMANAAGAKYILPIHHYTFRFGRENPTEPVERLKAALSTESDRLALSEAGQTFSIS